MINSPRSSETMWAGTLKFQTQSLISLAIRARVNRTSRKMGQAARPQIPIKSQAIRLAQIKPIIWCLKSQRVKSLSKASVQTRNRNKKSIKAKVDSHKIRKSSHISSTAKKRWTKN